MRWLESVTPLLLLLTHTHIVVVVRAQDVTTVPSRYGRHGRRERHHHQRFGRSARLSGFRQSHRCNVGTSRRGTVRRPGRLFNEKINTADRCLSDTQVHSVIQANQQSVIQTATQGAMLTKGNVILLSKPNSVIQTTQGNLQTLQVVVYLYIVRPSPRRRRVFSTVPLLPPNPQARPSTHTVNVLDLLLCLKVVEAGSDESLSANEDSPKRGRHDALTRRPSYRKILNDIAGLLLGVVYTPPPSVPFKKLQIVLQVEKSNRPVRIAIRILTVNYRPTRFPLITSPVSNHVYVLIISLPWLAQYWRNVSVANDKLTQISISPQYTVIMFNRCCCIEQLCNTSVFCHVD